MSLKSATEKIDGILQAVVLLVTAVMWAAFGFPFTAEIIGFGYLVVTAAALHWWIVREQP
jgi:hypothetical protein